MEITKRQDGYGISGMNAYGRFVETDLTGLETIEEAEQKLLNQKSKEEIEKERIEHDKEFLLDEFVKGKKDDELLQHPNLFPKLSHGLKIKKNKIYNYINELFRAKEDFVYDVQQSPLLEPSKWQKLGEPELSEYEKLYKTAKPWSRDESYDKGTCVIWYGKLYRAKERITTEQEPGRSDKWELIKK